MVWVVFGWFLGGLAGFRLVSNFSNNVSAVEVVTLWYICANLIENVSLVTSTDKKIQSDNGHICNNPTD